MKKVMPSLENAVVHVLDKIDAVLKNNGYKGPPVEMYIAGGVAVNYFSGHRNTCDLDATFSKRIVMDFDDLSEIIKTEDGQESLFYFDQNYNNTICLTHENYDIDSLEWDGINNGNRLVVAKLLSPIDLALSKITRNGEQDVDDILQLAQEGLFTADELEERATEALDYVVGNVERDRNTVRLVCERIREEVESRPRP